MMELLTDIELWKLLSIPVVAALVGWGTNWIAIQLTFYPLEFVGLYNPWLGWQGIIPSKARKMAAVGVDATLSKLGSLSEVFAQMEPEKITQQIVTFVEPQLDELTDDVIHQSYPVLWESLPAGLKQRVYSRIHQEFPQVIEELIQDIGTHLEDLLDLTDMITEHLVKDKALLNRIFLECGAREFHFIIHSGLYFGGLFGLIQMGVWSLYRGAWILPFFGFLVGIITNWIALNIIFRPMLPVKIGPFTLQGLFLKRQQEVAAVYSRLITHEIITIQNIADTLLNGPRSPRCRVLIKKHLQAIVDESVGMAKLVLQGALGAKSIDELKKHTGETAVELSQKPFEDPVFNKSRADIIEGLMRERMEALPVEDFVQLLRPCFQEDEWKLLLLGGALGLAAGFAQLFLVFGGA